MFTEAVTKDSQYNNVRPYIIPGSEDSPLRLTWMFGNYYDWIVSSRYPQGYCTGIVFDFKGFPDAKKKKNLVTEKNFKVQPEERLLHWNKPSLFGLIIKAHFATGDLEYYLDGKTMKPEVRYKGKVYTSSNILEHLIAGKQLRAVQVVSGTLHKSMKASS